MKKYDFLIVGAGLTGSVLAERIASQLNKRILIIDKRNHIGGNCYDYYQNSILIQKYGPHIFHTNNKNVLSYLSQFTEWIDYKYRGIAFYKGKYYQIPINLNTINLFYDLHLKNEKEIKDFLETKKAKIKNIRNSRDSILSKVGEDLYNIFIKYYTKKQWDKFPEELDRSVLERFQIRYDENPYYFSDNFQGLPKLGYNKMFERMLNNKKITIMLNTDFFKIKEKINYKKLIYTGPIDGFFDYKFGKLEYRGINFIFETHNKKSYQPYAIINYPDKNVEFTRVTEFKKLIKQKPNKTIICKEFPTWEGEPAYPIINPKNLKLFRKYINESKSCNDIIFIGRLAQYKYLNMDQVVEAALNVFNKLIK